MQTDKITSISPQHNIAIEYGTLLESEADGFLVQGQSGFFHAQRAFSCLVKPQPGDRVMFSRDDTQCHILAIIQRIDSQAAQLSFSGDVAIQSEQGQVSISGQDGVQMASPGAIAMVSEQIDMIASEGHISIQQATLSGQQVTSHIGSLQTFAKSIDTVAGRFTQRLKNSFRQIEGVDQTRAGDVLTTIRNLFSLRARQSALLAEKDIKIDAERIHMG